LLEKPVIDSTRPDGELRIRADRATLDQTTRKIVFEDNVEVRRREAGTDPLRARMPTLLVDLKARTGATDDPVSIDQGSSTLSGIGLDIDLEQESFSLRRDVRAVFNRPASPR
jgi:LPS export ABC transporter protein LptC